MGGLVYFGRMLDKIRAHAKGALPPDYVREAGEGFRRTLRALSRDLKYDDVVARVKEGGTDEEIFGSGPVEHGRKPSEEDMRIWNEFMRKCGWKDSITRDTRAAEKGRADWKDRADIETMFQFIDADEGRPVDVAPAGDRERGPIDRAESTRYAQRSVYFGISPTLCGGGGGFCR